MRKIWSIVLVLCVGMFSFKQEVKACTKVTDKIGYLKKDRVSDNNKGTYYESGYLYVTCDPLMNQRVYAECWYTTNNGRTKGNTINFHLETPKQHMEKYGDFWREWESCRYKTTNFFDVYNNGRTVKGMMEYRPFSGK